MSTADADGAATCADGAATCADGAATCAGFLGDTARTHPHADAVVLPGDRVSYRELDAGARRWARRLLANGVKPGEHVGILLPNGTEYMQVLFGILFVGAVPVPINARFSGREMADLAVDADLTLIIAGDHAGTDFSARVAAAIPQIASLHTSCPSSDACGDVQTDAEIERRCRAADPEDIALILYTSGSTSRPKGCLLSHRAILTQGRLLAARYAMSARDRIWAPLPMFHVGGISPLIAIASVGGAFLSMQRFEPRAALEMLCAERTTIAYVLFQTIITDLLNDPTFAGRDLTAIRLMISNLAMQPPWLREQITARVPGALQLGTFGMTETVGAACTHSPDDDVEDRVNRLGRALPGVEVRIVDAAGRDLQAGAIGEVLLKGPTVCSGYYRDEQKTASALRGGWFHSGDRGSLDARGSIMFHGRMKDVLKVGGENVGALEVELVVGMHPAVQCCAVVAAPHPRLVEVPVAYVELRPGAQASAEDITEFCTQKLAGFKVPRSVYFLSAWPMNATKIDKLELVRRLPQRP